MPEDRQAEYLDRLDHLAATDCNGFPLSFDEWNASNARMGRPCGTWGEYLNYCRNYVPTREYNALVQFGAEDTDYLGG